MGRRHVTANLRVGEVEDIFATREVALASTDDDGPRALMSCQHALTTGYDVAADLDLPAIIYRQPQYATCLDLGGSVKCAR